MKIEVSKETGIKTSSMAGPVGEPDIWYWVKVSENGRNTVSQCFRDKEEAMRFYEGLLKHVTTYKTAKTIIEPITTYDDGEDSPTA